MQIRNYSLVEKLSKSGFSEKEARIYVALLELGGAYPSKVSQYTDINRSTVYHTLTNLSVRGIVNEIEKRNKIFYQVERPERIIRYGEDKIRRAEEDLDQIKSILPNIEGLFSSLDSKPKVTYYENTEGIMAIYEDMISFKNKYEMLAFSNAAELEHAIPTKFFEKFRKRKEILGITTRAITPDTAGDRSYNEKFFTGYKKEIIPVIRFVSAEKFKFKGEITAYGDNRVSIINLNKEYLTGIIIEDQTIHNMIRLIFELSWDSPQVMK
jgi:sugar-specific transcriptional regulator TrmB